MKIKSALIALTVAGSLTGCQTLMDTFLVSEGEVMAMSEQACAESDTLNKVAPASSKYTKRINKIAKNLGKTTSTGVPLTYKVYLTSDVNAWAMANGCVRVYSGLMDIMTDDEVQGVLGHEIGHVALGHSTKRMQTAMAASMAIGGLTEYGGDAVSKYGGKASKVTNQLTDKDWNTFLEDFINAQFSQSQETASDNYSFDLLKSKKLNTMALATAFDKLAAKGSHSNIFSSHPDANSRSQNIRNRIATEGK